MECGKCTSPKAKVVPSRKLDLSSDSVGVSPIMVTCIAEAHGHVLHIIS